MAIDQTAEHATGADASLCERAGWFMHLTRAVEDAGHRLYLQGRLFGSFYGGRGQEATAVGAALAMAERDVASPAIRDMGAHLVRGIEPYEVLLHYLGREGSLTRGRDGSVHLGDLARGTLPMISHLPETMPVALGVALARRHRGERAAALVFCGDGASCAGPWHEAMNLAAVWRVPAVVIVEHNGWSYMTRAERAIAVEHISVRAAGYGMPGIEVDGNDALAVHAVVAEALARARAGDGPTLVEAWTYRMGGHGSHDGAAYVPRAELEAWEQRDPLRIWAVAARAEGLSEARIEAIAATARRVVDEAVARALAAPLPVYDPARQQVFAGEGEP